jgi:hypothetical protein
MTGRLLYTYDRKKDLKPGSMCTRSLAYKTAWKTAPVKDNIIS